MANRLSPEGRAACSEAGKRNIRQSLAARSAVGHEREVARKQFEAALELSVGPEPSPAVQALILSATASFEALFIVRAKLRSARSFKRVAVLVDALPALQGALSRTLRALGMEPVSGGEDPDRQAEPAEPGAPRSLAEWTESWRARQAPDREEP